MREKWWRWIGVIFFNLVIVLVSLELILRIFPQWMPYAQIWHSRRHYAEMSRLFFKIKEDFSGQQILTSNFKVVGTYFKRGAEVPQEKAAMLKDINPQILLLGDSFTRGAEVPLGMEWASLVQNNFSERLLNLGVGGSSTVEQGVLLSHSTWIQPKIVLLGLYAGDFEQNIGDLERYRREGGNPFIDRIIRSISDGLMVPYCEQRYWYLIPSCYFINFNSIGTFGNLFLKMTNRSDYLPEVPNLSSLHYIPEGKFYISSIPDTSLYTSDEKLYSKFKEKLTITFSLIKSIFEICQNEKFQLLIVYFPSQFEVYLTEFAKINGHNIVPFSWGKVLQVNADQAGIPFLDMTNNFRAIRLSEAPIFLKYDNHMTANGHRLAAQWITAFLKQHL